jgi:hypothetical protein
MHIVKHCAIAATGALALTGLAVAAELSETQLKEIFVGKTVYVETLGGTSTGAQGQGMIYYAPDGMATFKTPKGEVWQGKYTIKGNELCTDWKQMPNNPCSRYDKQGDAINIVNVATKQARAKVVKTAPGNPEKLGQ